MYVAKFDKNGIFWRITLFKKEWSNDILSNEIEKISTKNFLFHGSGYRWIYKEIGKNLFINKQLEVIDG